MRKIQSTGNCWQSFVACMLDVPLGMVAECSTVNDDWYAQTQRLSGALRQVFVVEADPKSLSTLPNGSLVGAHIQIQEPRYSDQDEKRSHIVVAQVEAVEQDHAPVHYFRVFHDPSNQIGIGESISPDRIVLFCRYDTWPSK